MKKKLLSLALACGMVFSLAACGTPANNESPAPNTESPAIGTETPAADTPTYEPATVRVAYMPNLGSAGSLFVGIEQGYFEEVGLTVETFEFQGGPAEIAAMASGDIDISQIGHGAHKLCRARQKSSRWITPPPCRMWWWATRPRALKPSRI